ncbi:hypothetical protein GCM10018783_01070 [Streptomyces griseosporeus]|nr:hypothetical protein GCM10018783_01070 [Streptomyces griseosporeus]
MLGDPVSLGSGSQDRRKAVLVADLDRQPAVFVYVDVEAQDAVSADAGCLAWSQVGQRLLSDGFRFPNIVVEFPLVGHGSGCLVGETAHRVVHLLEVLGCRR